MKSNATVRRGLMLSITITLIIGLMIQSLLLIFLYSQLQDTKSPASQTGADGELLPISDYSVLKSYFSNAKARSLAYNIKGIREEIGIADTQSTMGRADNYLGSSSTEFTKTNVQTSGVDEGDIIKTDGSYIYTVSNTKVIINKADKGELTLSAELELGNIREMYLAENLLTVIYTEPSDSLKKNSSDNNVISDDMLYCYIEDLQIRVNQYDISDPAAPALISDYLQQGSLVSSRVTDGILYLVSVFNSANTENLSTENLSASDIAEAMPKCGFDEGDRLQAQSIFIPSHSYSTGLTIVSAITLGNQKEANSKTIVGNNSTVYSSKEGLYIVGTEYSDIDNYTVINRIDISGGELGEIYSTRLDGRILNKYSMDEYNGTFRIASTVSTTGDNFVTVFDCKLNPLGKTESFAKGESIYSVRFMNEMGYVVTFLQIDPLFAISFENPEKPIILGELKVPGFSQYLHPYGSDRLIGFGTDTVSDTDTSISGLKLTLFDISDGEELSELDILKFKEYDNLGDFSNAQVEPHAFLFDKSRALIGLPLTDYKSGVPEFHYSLFTIKGDKLSLEKSIPLNGEGMRAIIIGDYLYVLEQDALTSFSINNDYIMVSKYQFAD